MGFLVPWFTWSAITGVGLRRNQNMRSHVFVLWFHDPESFFGKMWRARCRLGEFPGRLSHPGMRRIREAPSTWSFGGVAGYSPLWQMIRMPININILHYQWLSIKCFYIRIYKIGIESKNRDYIWLWRIIGDESRIHRQGGGVGNHDILRCRYVDYHVDSRVLGRCQFPDSLIIN